MSRLWETAGAGHRRQPPGLDNDGAVLHAAIATRAARDRTHYFDAMAAHTGNPAYARLSDIPPAATLTAGDGVDPERSALYSTARGVAISAGISWHDALAWLEGLHELEALRRDDGGAGQPPWLDTRPLASPPRPWSDADWSRDQRRAAAAGLDVDHAQWQAGAEVGRDVVGETAAAQRQDRLVRAQQNHAQLLPAAKEREDTRRAAAIHDELHARARKRLAESTPRGSLNALAAAHDADIYRPPAPKPFDVGELAPQSTPAAHNGHARMGPASAP
jgi:hypothetical protein